MIVKIMKCELRIVDPANAKKVLNNLHYLRFTRTGDYLVIEFDEMKWSSLIELDMLMLSSVARGYITFRGDEEDFRLRIAGEGKLEWQKPVCRYETTHVLAASGDIQQGRIDGGRYSLYAEEAMMVLEDRETRRRYSVSLPDIGILLQIIKKDQSDRVLQALEPYIEPLE